MSCRLLGSRSLLGLLMGCLLMGCSSGERFEVESVEDVRKERDRICGALPEEEAADLRDAVNAVMVDRAMQITRAEDRKEVLVATFDGKTPDEILELYHEMEPGKRKMLAAEARVAEERADRERERVEALEAAFAEFDRLEAEAEQNKKPFASRALTHINLEYGRRAERDGELEAAKWFREQVEGKTLDEVTEIGEALEKEWKERGE